MILSIIFIPPLLALLYFFSCSIQQFSSAHQDIKQDAPIESDKIPITYHEKLQTENNAESLTKPNDVIICKLMNFNECYKIDWNTKLFSTKPNGT